MGHVFEFISSETKGKRKKTYRILQLRVADNATTKDILKKKIKECQAPSMV